ncbi:putative capsular polysaccharide biosynthesis protein YwqC [Lentibacillus sp. JNUCC-1]|uniref:YveK family protein n=1 Tax=Lentibacillus sp. JNUCC-1 TaxID=2654513 RepID=UPI0012E8653D|nr:Wzz/FepE/Etk N-terminal domain-containing protein [Lentibacillus sp. JNUCC-1]MUV37288.1 putative capsular polysaccharide biosynthesis protein YwqC [Lentibacillus sp. JNUCC-1]
MEETISLQEIFAVIKKRMLLIIGLIAAAAVIAGVVSFFVLTPTYQSTSQFIVNQGQQDPNAQFNVNDIRTNVELINTYTVIIKSPAILDEVVDELDLPYTAGTLGEKFQVSSEQNSQVVTVTATDPDPAMATELSNTVVEVFQEKVPVLMNGVDNVSILSEAKTVDNPSPVSPKPMLNIAIAVVLGAMVGVGLAFLLEYLDTTLKTEEDIEKHLELPVLGIVTHVSETEARGRPAQAHRRERGKRNVPQKRSI